MNTEHQTRREILTKVLTKVTPTEYLVTFDKESGRYRLGPADLHCGDCFQFQVRGMGSHTGSPRVTVWVDARIEHADQHFYLVTTFGNVTSFAGVIGRAT